MRRRCWHTLTGMTELESLFAAIAHGRFWHFATLRCEAAIRTLSGVKWTCAPPISHPEPEWSHCAPATAALENGAYAQRAAGEQDAAIRTARNAQMRIEEHIGANE